MKKLKLLLIMLSLFLVQKNNAFDFLKDKPLYNIAINGSIAATSGWATWKFGSYFYQTLVSESERRLPVAIGVGSGALLLGSWAVIFGCATTAQSYSFYQGKRN